MSWLQEKIKAGVYKQDTPERGGLFNTTKEMNPFSKGNMGSTLGALGTLASPLLSGGNSSPVGNLFGTASSVVGSFNPIAGAALGVAGGLINGAIGSNINEGAVAAIKGETDRLKNFTSNATSFYDIPTMPVVSNFTQSDVGSDGWASDRAETLYGILKDSREKAQRRAALAIGNNIETLKMEQGQMAQKKIINAFGGPLDFVPIMGAIDYEIAQRKLALKETESKKSLGGPLHSNGVDWTNGLILVDQGGTHEENPNEGVQMGVAPDGTPNLVEEGEVIWNDYVFSNRIKVPEDIKKKYKLRGSDDMTFADAARKAQKPSAERPNDLIEMRSLEDIMAKLMTAQEDIRAKKIKGKKGNRFDLGGLRFAPVLGSGLAVLSDLAGWTNKPDYSSADTISGFVNSLGNIGGVSYKPVGEDLAYIPMDRLFYSNRLGAKTNTLSRNVLNTSGLNRGTAMAGLLAVDHDAQMQQSNLFRQAEEFDLGQRAKVADFRKSVGMFNSEADLKAQMANLDSRTKRAGITLEGLTKAGALRDAVDATSGAARSANLTNLFDNLGNLGRETTARNMILSNPALYYSIDSKGNITYKNGYETLSDAAKDEVNRHAAKAKGTSAYGGYLTIRRR